MLKTTAAALIAGTLTIAAATQAHEMLDLLAPEAASVVADANLRTVYREAKSMSMLQNVPMDFALKKVSEKAETEGVRYSVAGQYLTAETDWSCRIAFYEEPFIQVMDCPAADPIFSDPRA